MLSARRKILVALPYLWLVTFFLIPFSIVLKIALSDSVAAMPPYVPVWEPGSGLHGILDLVTSLDVENFITVLEDNVYMVAYLNSVRIAAVTTVICLLAGYPIAYAISSAPASWKPVLIMMVNLPFWTSFLIRIYAWIIMLSKEGVLNHLLLEMGIISEPLVILNTTTAVYLGLVYAYLPLMIFPIYAVLEKLDSGTYEAARDLGCTHREAFFHVTLPISRPGILAGCFLVFIPVTGEFVVPSLLGNSSTPMIGRLLWEEFFVNRDWPLAAAISVLLLAILVIPIILFQNYQSADTGAGK